jgi:hypothetical protein
MNMTHEKKIKHEKIVVDISYLVAEKDQQGRVKKSGVDISDNILINGLNIQITGDTELDWDSNEFIENGNYQVNLRGTKKAYYELGKLLLTLSRYSEQDPNYHIHLENIKGLNQSELTHLIIHVPTK